MTQEEFEKFEIWRDQACKFENKEAWELLRSACEGTRIEISSTMIKIQETLQSFLTPLTMILWICAVLFGVALIGAIIAIIKGKN